jgi:hypothetical protein
VLTVIRLNYPPEDYFPEEPEGAAFCTAFQDSAVPNFRSGFLAVYRTGTRIAVLPYFVTVFRVSTMLGDGLIGRSLAWLKLGIACVGHPSTDFGLVQGEVSEEVLDAVNRELSKESSLVSYKGFAGDLPLPGFVKVKGLPVPILSVREDFYSRLPSHRRNDLRRKLKKARDLRIEEYAGLPRNLTEEIFNLYLQTYERASIKFERLTVDYFEKTSRLSKFLVIYEDARPAAFAQMMCGNGKMVHKYVGIDYTKNRQYGLYFLLFLKAIDICMREGYGKLEFGVSDYYFKRFLGSTLTDTYNYYRHDNCAMQWLLGKSRCLIEPSKESLA